MMRAVIVHYHLFKNAGTSLDRTLRENLGGAWTELEGEDRRPLRPAELAEFLLANPWAKGVSSHTAVLPVPTVADTVIIPIFFVRHPLDRLRSVYDFEHTQDADTPGAMKAKETDIAGYIEWRLARPRDHTAVNFQTFRLAGGKDDLRRAMQTIEALPFVGLVEEYDLSVARLEDVLSEDFPKLRLRSYRANVTADRQTLDERLAQLQRRLGHHLYQRLERANSHDLQLWQAVRARYVQSSVNTTPGY